LPTYFLLCNYARMSKSKKAKYKFSLENAQKARLAFNPLVNKRYLDSKGVVRKVKKIVIAPFDEIQLAKFLKEFNLLVDHDIILKKYKTDAFALLLLVEAQNGSIEHFTIEEFEKEFGVRSDIIEMAINYREV
jgi:hypothetical protein